MLTLSFLVAVIAMLVPFFNDVVGLLGALGFWPLTVFLPTQMHLKQAGMFFFAALQWPCLCCLATAMSMDFATAAGCCCCCPSFLFCMHYIIFCNCYSNAHHCVATASSLLLYLLL